MSQKNMKWLIGIDEAGRGPLAGPVAVGAVCLLMKKKSHICKKFKGVKDSKALSEKERERWLKIMLEEKRNGNIDFHVSMSSHSVIDTKGLVFAIRSGLARALLGFGLKKSDEKKVLVLLDGTLRAPKKFFHQKTLIRGDEKELVIALASIVAKVSRDKKMVRASMTYPEYAFEKHKGYGTKAHYEILKKIGPCDIHRRSFLGRLTIK